MPMIYWVKSSLDFVLASEVCGINGPQNPPA
jgi:hypothetical protein